MTTVVRSFFAIVFCLTFGSIFGSMASADEGQDQPFVTALLSFKEDSLQIQATIQKKPVVGQESFIILEAKKTETQENIEIFDSIDVSLWMPNMGHGSAPTNVEKALNETGEIIPGVYRVREVFFTMGGLWEVNITLTDSQGKTEAQTFTVQLKGGHHH